jgi:hypothetical protein
MWIVFRSSMAIAVLACIAASATFAFEFVWTRGATEVYRWTYAFAGIALDLFKSGVAILGASAWHDRKPVRAFACWMVFTVLRMQRDALKFTETSEDAVRTGEATVATGAEQANAERARGGCRDLCRQREGEGLLLAQQNRAATVKAAEPTPRSQRPRLPSMRWM